MPAAERRRRIARYVLAGLVFVHVSAYIGYEIYNGQINQRQLALEARDEWREGHLALAAAEYTRYLADYRRTTWPLVVVRNLPSEASIYFALGRVNAERHLTDAALAAFTESMHRERGLGRREYRDVLFESGRYTALEAFARAALAEDPKSLAAIFDLGAALYAEGRWADAARAYERGLSYVADYLKATDPGFSGRVSVPEAELLNLAAVADLAAGEPERATETCAGLSARLTPTQHLDRLCRAFLEAEAGHLEASRSLIKDYIPVRPEQEALAAALEARLAAAGS